MIEMRWLKLQLDAIEFWVSIYDQRLILYRG